MNTVLEFLSHGLIGQHWLVVLGLFLLFTHFTVLAVTIFLHRCQAHRACDLHPAVAHVFRFWLWLTTGMVTREWVAIHRKHHARVETEDDPHSPQYAGIGKVLMEGAELYREEVHKADTLEKFGRGTPDDWIERHVYKYGRIGPTLLILINIGLFGAIGITFWALQMMWIPFFAAGVINGLGHWWGYRNFDTPDTAHNITPIAFFLGGEELHNNHHAFPSSAKFSLRRFEFDLGWQVLRGLSGLKLARIRRVAPGEPAVTSKRPHVDAEVLRAVLTYRFQLLRHYWREVVIPVVSEEARLAGDSVKQLKRRVGRLLKREERFLDARKQAEREALLADRPRLATVYEYRQRLQAIWSGARGNSQALVDALAEWCREAEASGIRALELYAARIRRLSPVSV